MVIVDNTLVDLEILNILDKYQLASFTFFIFYLMHRKHELKKWKNSSKSVYLHFFVDAFKIHSLFSIYFSKLVPQNGKLFLLLYNVF